MFKRQPGSSDSLKDDEAGFGGGDTSDSAMPVRACQIALFRRWCLTEASIENKSCEYVISSTPETSRGRAGLVFVAVESCKAGRLPNLLKGPIRIAADRDQLFFLDRDGRQHQARIVSRSPPPPPPPIP